MLRMLLKAITEQKYIFHHSISKNMRESRGVSLQQKHGAGRPPHSWTGSTGINYTKETNFSNNMSNGGYHRRQDSQYCGSESNHSSTHQPKDKAGVLWQKTSKTCLPRYQERDREMKIKYVAEKMNNDFEKKRKTGQCFPTRK